MMIFDIPTTAAAVMFAMAAIAMRPMLRDLKPDPDDAPLRTRVDSAGIAHREERAEIEHFEAAMRELKNYSPSEPPLSDFAKKRRTLPEPPASPKLDQIAEFKLQLRTMNYGDFMEAVKGMGGENADPKTAWKWATA
jgi:hypothetical protein